MPAPRLMATFPKKKAMSEPAPTLYTVSRKNQVRRDMLERRRALSTEARETASRKILQRLYSEPIYLQAGTVMAYAPIKDEVSLYPLLENCLKENRKLAIPLITGKGHMEAVHVPSLDVLTEGAYGILTVAEEKRQLLSPELIDCVIVPGAAFSIRGDRLGLGAGYYDRFLERCTEAARIALAFSCQVANELPIEPHDVKMDMIITEAGCIKIRETSLKKGFETVAKR